MPPKIVIVGGGLAGLSAAMRVAEMGIPVDLFSLVPVRRSHSVCAQGGINGAVNTKGEGDSTWQHFDDSVYGGDFLANQPPVKAMADAAPAIIYLFDRMGVPFNRTPEGLIDFRRFGGTRMHRTAFAGATTGQQLLYALDEQVRRFQAAGLVTKHEHDEFLGPVLDDEGVCRGLAVQDLHTMEIRTVPADAVILATGGVGMIFGKSTNSVINTGTATSAAYQAGVIYANPEMIQVHPTAIPGDDKLRLMSESIRGEGGRLWVPRDGKPWYFLEEWYPSYGNLVPRDIATRAIFKVVVDMKLGVDGKNMVYLDVSHLPAQILDEKLEGVVEIYQKFVGDDPHKVPMKVFPGMHYSMGGLWVDYDQMTNLPGLFACGETDYQYHGANRLGANSLLSCVYGGMVTGPNAVRYAQGLEKGADAVAQSVYAAAKARHEDRVTEILHLDGSENPYLLHKELGEWMTENVTVIRYNDRLDRTREKLHELKDRWFRIGLPDKSPWANASLSFTRQLWNMFILSEAIVAGARLRDESRGAHYKPDFPDRDDEHFLKTTRARFTEDGPEMDYEAVDVSLLTPRLRHYD